MSLELKKNVDIIDREGLKVHFPSVKHYLEKMCCSEGLNKFLLLFDIS